MSYSQQLQTHYDRHVEQLALLRQIAAQLTNTEMLTFCNGQITKCLDCMSRSQTKINVIQMAQHCGFTDAQMEAFICDTCTMCDNLVTEKVDAKVTTAKNEVLVTVDEAKVDVLTQVDEKVATSKAEVLTLVDEKVAAKV